MRKTELHKWHTHPLMQQTNQHFVQQLETEASTSDIQSMELILGNPNSDTGPPTPNQVNSQTLVNSSILTCLLPLQVQKTATQISLLWINKKQTQEPPHTQNTHSMITRDKLRKNPTLDPHLHKAIQHSKNITQHKAMVVEPKSYKSALKIPQWKQAMEEDMKALEDNHTWDLVTPPRNTNIVGSKWIFKTKLKEDGTIDRYL